MSLLLPEFQEKESQFQNMQIELQDKGSVLSKAWSDLFGFITNYQAQLTLKENALELAEKEIEIQKKQSDELKPMIEAANVQAWQLVQLQEQCLSKERLLNEAKCEVKEIEKKFLYVQSELETNRELFEQSKKELQCRNTQLMLSKQDVNHHATQSKIYVDQLAIQNSLVRKFRSQVMKLGMENTELRQKLDAERSKRNVLDKMSIETTNAEVDADVPTPDNADAQELSDSNDQDTGLEPPIKRERRDPDIRMTPSTITDGDTSNLHLEPFKCSVISPSGTLGSKKVLSKTWTPVTAQGVVEEEEEDTSLNASSDVYFPLSVEGESKSSLMLPGGTSAGGMMDDVADQMLPRISRANNEPVPISEPIPSTEMAAQIKTKSGMPVESALRGLDTVMIKSEVFEDDAEPSTSGMFKDDSSDEESGSVHAPSDKEDTDTEIGETDDRQQGKMNTHIVKSADVNKDKKTGFPCKYCGLSLARKGGLVRHLKIHTGDMVPCPQCPRKFFSEAEVRKHMLFHENPKYFECKICFRDLKSRCGLRQHMQNHAGTYMFKCDKCDRGYNNISTFKMHLRRHDNIKPHVCEHCGKAFTLSGDQRRHSENCINPEPQHQCNICGTRLKGLRSLKTHILAHDESNRVCCEHCGKSYYAKNTLLRHIRKQHPEKVEPKKN